MKEDELKKWEDIKDDFTDWIILGNGSSMAIDSKKFSYKSILSEAQKSELLSDDIKTLFSSFNTDDFEHILYMLWITLNTNKALNIKTKKIESAYRNIQNALINTIRIIHPKQGEIKQQLENIGNFLKHFSTIINLNYDLIVYWAILFENDKKDGVFFKDLFLENREFAYDIDFFYKPRNRSEKAIAVVYPHGNLIFGENILGETKKIVRSESQNEILEEIIARWGKDDLSPLFISEGNSKQKLNAIRRHGSYLSFIYDKFLTREKETIVIYGWAIGDQDDHIIEAIQNSSPKKIAVSVYTDDSNWNAHIEYIKQKLEIAFPKIKENIYFFDSKSKGCWNN